MLVAILAHIDQENYVYKKNVSRSFVKQKTFFHIYILMIHSTISHKAYSIYIINMISIYSILKNKAENDDYMSLFILITFKNISVDNFFFFLNEKG